MRHRTVRSAALILPIIAFCALSGCSGLAMLMAWDQWFNNSGDDPTTYRAYLDGYDLSSTASASGLLSLPGVADGDYLVTVAKSPEKRRGIHALVHVEYGKAVNLRSLNPFEGGVITGTVRRDTTSGPVLANVRVIAVRNGASLIASGGPLTIPAAAGSSLEYMMGYTDDSGQYRLGPAKYGQWLVFATQAGYGADAHSVNVQSGADGSAVLALAQDTSMTTGVVRGTVTSRAGAVLSAPLITARLDAPYQPQISTTLRTRISTEAGVTMPEGPWFSLGTLTAIGSATGVYSLDLPAGGATVQGYKLRFKATDATVTITSGGVVTQDFAIPSTG
jgi:hypothetical protein